MSKQVDPADRDVDPILIELRQCRLDAGFKQNEVGEELGFVSGTSIGQYELGKGSPKLDTLQAWSAMFDRRLVLVQDGQKSTPQSRAAKKEIDERQSVRLTKYQIALAMGMLLAASHDTPSAALSSDLQEIADTLALQIRG